MSDTGLTVPGMTELPCRYDVTVTVDEGRAVRLPRGKLPLFSNRVAWAVTFLAQAGLLDRPARGITQITVRGSEALTRYP